MRRHGGPGGAGGEAEEVAEELLADWWLIIPIVFKGMSALLAKVIAVSIVLSFELAEVVDIISVR